MSTMIGPCPTPDDLAAWLEGGLSPQEHGTVTSHLAACDDCRRAVGVASLVDEAPARALDEVLLARVVTASRRRPVWMWAVAGALLVALALGFVLFRPAPQPEVRSTADAPKIPGPVVIRENPPAPEPVVAPTPEAPKPVVKVDEKPEPPKPEESKPVVKVEEKPEPPKPAPEPEKPREVVKETPKETVTDLSTVFGPVFMVDPTGDLWLRGAKAGAFEQAGYKDTFSSREGAGFTLDARASVALEKGAAAGLSWFKPDQAYTVHSESGLVMVDTEGATYSFRVTRGGATVVFSNLNGCLAVEPRGDQVAATLLRGKSDLKIGAEVRKAEVGREIVLAADGKTTQQPGETKKKLDRLMALRPKSSTIFAASFDEKKDEVSPFPYKVLVGRVSTGPSGLFLEAVKAGDKLEVAAALQPDRAISVTSDMVVRFRYRTTLPSFTVRLGQHAATFVAKTRTGQWADGEIRRDAFAFEGVTLEPSAEVAEVRFTGVVPRNVGSLEVDAVQFLRRAR
jgi:hypothetical protein